MSTPVLKLYHERLSSKEIVSDQAQKIIIERLDQLAEDLLKYRAQTQASFQLFRLRRGPPSLPKGFYLYGSVGAGKTMLMDLFFQGVHVTPKRRVHFHAFMQEVHERIARGRSTTEGDPIPYVAAEISGEAVLLCFDEFHVTDIADAMILGRLFKALFEKNVVIVATSNVPPDKLYWNGLNRQLFVPFIELMKDKLNVVPLSTEKDYRLQKLAGQELYFSPANEKARAELDRLWDKLTDNHPPTSAEVEHKGRAIHIPQSARGVARFTFKDLCATTLGSGDYLELVRHYHTILIEDIPILTAEQRNEARRFINLIDTLYDHGVSLIVSANAEPHDLYREGDGVDLFQRTASRLMEMRSQAYLKSRFSQKIRS